MVSVFIIITDDNHENLLFRPLMVRNKILLDHASHYCPDRVDQFERGGQSSQHHETFSFPAKNISSSTTIQR